jgi:hypothetical protein
MQPKSRHARFDRRLGLVWIRDGSLSFGRTELLCHPLRTIARVDHARNYKDPDLDLMSSLFAPILFLP